jgi:hypothetical protein
LIHSPFGDILRATIGATPGAVGGALAAGDGETVDFWTALEDEEEWYLITAHFGIVIDHIRRALHTFHFGDIEFIQLCYDELELLIQIVDGQYYVLMALKPPVHLGAARRNLRQAAVSLREEMLS